MQNYFYRDQEGREIGPLDLATLAKFRSAGVVSADTPIRATDSTDWKPCREIIAEVTASPSVTSPQSVPPARGSGGRKNQWVIYALVVIAVVIGIRFVLFADPSTSDGKQAIENCIKAESEGRIRLTNFQKTNATKGELRGVKFYVMEYETEIEFTEDCK